MFTNLALAKCEVEEMIQTVINEPTSDSDNEEAAALQQMLTMMGEQEGEAVDTFQKLPQATIRGIMMYAMIGHSITMIRHWERKTGR